MRWLFLFAVLAAMLFAGGCECAKAVDDTATETAETVTGARTVKRGKQVEKDVKEAYDKAEKERNKRVDDLMNTQ